MVKLVKIGKNRQCLFPNSLFSFLIRFICRCSLMCRKRRLFSFRKLGIKGRARLFKISLRSRTIPIKMKKMNSVDEKVDIEFTFPNTFVFIKDLGSYSIGFWHPFCSTCCSGFLNCHSFIRTIKVLTNNLFRQLLGFFQSFSSYQTGGQEEKDWKKPRSCRKRLFVILKCEIRHRVYHVEHSRETSSDQFRKTEEWYFCTNCTGDQKLAETVLDVISASICCFVAVFKYLVMWDLLDLL